MAEEEKKGKGFVVKDRRIFDDSGEVRGETPTDSQEPPGEMKEKRQVFTKGEPREKERVEEPAHDGNYPPVNFANFVLSLSTTAMYHFGDFPDPESNKAEINLPAAKQTIDIIGMIKEKTAGNLDDNEKNLIEGILYELRLRYVKETKK
ncbi:MAG: DUF1844 domain-containing protein [Deltaproteobacteria bacterium]|nr:DUF1844 domain-containing protein [Deltaproteobacteria bacterium]